MSKTLPWFRVYSEILHDEKLKRVTRTLKASHAETIGVWVCLLALANKADERGRLTIAKGIPHTLEDIEAAISCDHKTIELMINEFIKLDMVDIGTDGAYEITNWQGRQFKSDNSTDRVQRFRERQSTDDETPTQGNDETFQKRYNETEVKRFSNALDTDTDTETDTDNKESHPSDFDKEFQIVWEKETGKPVAAAQQFYRMLDDFKTAGVTPTDYRTAIKEQSNSTYPVTNPTSVKNWALRLAAERTAPKPTPINGNGKAKAKQKERGTYGQDYAGAWGVKEQ